LSGAVSGGEQASVELLVDQSQQPSAPYLQGIVGGIVDQVDRSITGSQPVLQLDVAPVLAEGLSAIDFLVPGILAMSILNLGLFATAQPLISLRTQGVLKRLGATPLPRPTLLAANIAWRLTIAVLQTALIVGLGVVLFDVAMVGSWLAFIGWVLLGTLAFIAIGFFVAAIARTEESGIALVNLINFPMLFLSGVFFPVETLPGFLAPIVRALPLTYVVDALRQTMLDAPPVNPQWINLVVQVAWLVVMAALAIRFFRWEPR
jgi:ABC-2 type transport system permease protein